MARTLKTEDFHPADITDLADTIAELVIERLSQSVISSAFPAEIGDWIRKTCEYNSMYWVHSIPMQPHGAALLTEWIFNPDGTIRLELRDTNNQTFWRGTFRPVEGIHGNSGNG